MFIQTSSRSTRTMCWVTLCLSIPAREPYEQCVGLHYVYPYQLASHTNNVLGYIVFIQTSSRVTQTMCCVTVCLFKPAREPHEQCVGLHCVYLYQLARHTIIHTSSRATRFKFFNEIFPVWSSSNNLKAFIISWSGSRSDIFWVTVMKITIIIFTNYKMRRYCKRPFKNMAENINKHHHTQMNLICHST